MNLLILQTRIQQEFPVQRETVEFHPQRAAVLVILYPKFNGTNILMMKRATHLRNHAGEISFPGGVYQEEDGDLLMTALRETEEELNLEVGESDVIGRLDRVNTLTGFEVTPYIAFLDDNPVFEGSRDEVAEVLEIPLAPLLATQRRDVGYKPSDEMYVFWFQEHKIWGATARILHQIAELNHL